MSTILLDVDGVLADLSTPVHETAERLVGRILPSPLFWRSFDFADAMGLTPEERDLFTQGLIDENNIGWKVDLFPGALEFVDQLMSEHDVVFVTSQWSDIDEWMRSRENLIRNYWGPDAEIVFTHHKYRVTGSLLLDDNPAHLSTNFHRAVCFDAPWNQDFKGPRVYSYEHFLQYLERNRAA